MVVSQNSPTAIWKCLSPEISKNIRIRGNFISFSGSIKNRRIFITENYSNDPTITRDDEVISINGIPAAAQLKKIYDHLSGENEYFKNTQIDLHTFPKIYWLIYGRRDNFLLGLKKANDRTSHVNVEAIPVFQFDEKSSKMAPLFNINREFKFIGQEVAYLRPGIFLNNQSSGNTSEQLTFEKGEFIRFIDRAFEQIPNTQAKSLIIDLRGNPGGDNSFSDAMVAYFANKPFWFCSEFSVKTSRITKDFWRNVNDPALAELKNKILIKKDGEIFKVDFQKYQPRTDNLKFEGKVYVLIDRYSYLNTVATSAIVQDYGFGELVGEPTADTPTSDGAIHQFKLSHTQIAVSYPKAFLVRPNGDRSLRGITPDFEVADDRLNENDETLDFVLKRISEQSR